MRFGIKTLDDLDVTGKTVFCRVDINQPVDKTRDSLKSINRILACIPTIQELIEKKAKTVLLAHQGSDIEYKNYYTTRPHAKVLSDLLHQEIKFMDDVCGPAAREAIKNLKEGEVLLLDNVRYVAEEQTLFEMKLTLSAEEQAKTLLVKKLAPLGDYYVCDAFAAAHRSQPSLCGFEQILPSAMGRLFEKEYCAVSTIMEKPERPCIFVLGGAKISDAFAMMETVLKRGIADRVLTGGLVGNILLTAAGYQIGQGSLNFIYESNYGEYIEKARQTYASFHERILLPSDLAWTDKEHRREALIEDVPEDIMSVDIGSRTAENYAEIISEAKTVFVNGPMGVFEKEESGIGTRKIWQALADTDGFTVIGGGDSIAATEKYDLKEQMSYICTGGGALIRFLSGEELPVVKALRYNASIFS